MTVNDMIIKRNLIPNTETYDTLDYPNLLYKGYFFIRISNILYRRKNYGGGLMGFYYLLLLVIGIVLIVIGALKKDVPRSVKIVIFLFVIGIVFIVMSLILLLPGSSDVIAELLKWNS